MDSHEDVKEPPNSDRKAEPVLATYVHDFESTIQQYITGQSQLIGILNFSALWHEVVFLNDITLGDNPHLIQSFCDPAQSKLYSTIVEFIRAGVLRCHLRNKVAIKGTVLVESEPSLKEVFEGWWLDGPKERFTAQIFGDDRDRYNRIMDDWLRKYPEAVVRYDPDRVKPAFRNRVRQLLGKPNSELWHFLRKQPIEVQREYVKVCEKNEYFTNADLWRLVRNDPAAKELVIAHGHINQQCNADLVHAGNTGENLSNLNIPEFNWNLHVSTNLATTVHPPQSLEEILERAEFVLPSPALETLGLLSPEQIMELREKASNTIFRVARQASKDLGLDRIPAREFAELPTIMQYLPIDRFKKKYVDAMREYWQLICEFLEKKYPEHTKVKTRLGAVAYDVLSDILPALQNGVVGISLFTGLNWLTPGDPANLWKLLSAAGSGQILAYYLLKLAYHLLLERAPAAQDLRQLDLVDPWRPKGLYVTNRWE